MVFAVTGGAETATPFEMLSKDMNPDSTGSRVTQHEPRRFMSVTKAQKLISLAAALTLATTTRQNVTTRLPGAATPASLWHVRTTAHDDPKSP